MSVPHLYPRLLPRPSGDPYAPIGSQSNPHGAFSARSDHGRTGTSLGRMLKSAKSRSLSWCVPHAELVGELVQAGFQIVLDDEFGRLKA